MNDHHLEPGESFEDIYKPPAQNYRAIDLNNLDKQVIQELDRLVSELANWHPIMPKVDKSGNSECPFAEDMFRKKAKLESKIVEKMATLRDLLRDVERDITRCQHNLSRIAVDVTKLNHSIAKGHYEQAQGLQEREYLSAVGHRRIIVEALQRAETTLAASRLKQHPILTAEQATPKGLPASASSYSPDPLGHCLDHEVRDLFSLGRKLGPSGRSGKTK